MQHLVWDAAHETMPREKLLALSEERLLDVVRRVYEGVPYYRAKMQAMHVTPADIHSASDLHKLPFTEKTDLRDNYPFGLFAVPKRQIVRIHASSGTTGKPTVVGYTKNDIDTWAELMARSLTCAGVTRDSTVQVAYGYGLFTGGLGAHYGAERIGASVIPISGGNTQKQLMLMQDFGTTTICCTPSYALVLGEALRDSGLDPDTFSLQSGVFGAEPWTESMRKHLEHDLHIRAQDIYGLSEVMGPGVSMECACQQGMHIWEDHFLPEILDPDTGEPLPYSQTGEIVFTTLTKEGLPLLRYRTHDLTRLNPAPCACGRTHVRMERLTGRTDDMLIIRGVNVFPSQIEGVLAAIPGVSPNYLIVLGVKNNLDTLEVRVELTPAMMGDTVREIEALESRIRSALGSVLGLTVVLRLVPPGSLPRSEGKAKRVLDERNRQ